MGARTEEKIARVFLWAAALFTVGILLLILGYILVQGVGKLTPDFLLSSPRAMGREGGIFPAIVGTVYFTLVSLLFAAPIGVGSAIYLSEYAQDKWYVSVIRFAAETLAAVPSIVFGLFGFIFFVILLEPITNGWSIVSGALTAACMILPTLIRASEEAIRAVPVSYREGSFALGATRWQTVCKVVLPGAAPGILTAVILSIGRVVGETAALLLTLGGGLNIPRSIFEPTRTLALHLYLVAMEVGAMDMAFGTAAVLIIAVLLINLSAYWVMRRFIGKRAAV